MKTMTKTYSLPHDKVVALNMGIAVRVETSDGAGIVLDPQKRRYDEHQHGR